MAAFKSAEQADLHENIQRFLKKHQVQTRAKTGLNQNEAKYCRIRSTACIHFLSSPTLPPSPTGLVFRKKDRHCCRCPKGGAFGCKPPPTNETSHTILLLWCAMYACVPDWRNSSGLRHGRLPAQPRVPFPLGTHDAQRRQGRDVAVKLCGNDLA
jgi:hypothetical protein